MNTLAVQRALTSRRFALSISVATLLAATLWTRELASPLFIDEGASWYLAYQPSWGGFWALLKSQEVAPPPFYVGLRFIVHTLGQDGHTAMRLPVVLATLPSVPLGAALARAIGGSRKTAVAVAFLLALSPLMLEYGQQVRAYGPAMTFTLLACVLAVRATRAEAGRWGIAGAIAALAAGPWIHYVAAAPLVIVAIALGCRIRRRARWALLVALGISWLGAGLFAHDQYGNVGAGVDQYVDLRWQDLRHVFATAWDGRYRGSTWLLAIGTAVSVGVVVSLYRARGWKRDITLAALAGPTAIVALSALGPDITMSRYLAPAAPLVVVAFAVALDGSRIGAATLLVLAVCGAIGVERSLNRESGGYPDAEAVVRSALPTFGPQGATLASNDYNTALWLAIYVAERSGTQHFSVALGPSALVDAVCNRRSVRQLVAQQAPVAVQRRWYESIGYRTSTAPVADPKLVLIVADPTRRSACPRGQVPPPISY